MAITFALQVWFDDLEQDLLFPEVMARLDELKVYLQNPSLYWDNLSVIIGASKELEEESSWKLESYYLVYWLHYIIEEHLRFIRGGTFCFFGEDYVCWLFHATGDHVTMYTAPLELYGQYHPEPGSPTYFFQMDRDVQELRQETTLRPCFAVEIYDWIQGSLTVGRQYNQLLLAVKDFILPESPSGADTAETLYKFCATFPYYEQQMISWLQQQDRWPQDNLGAASGS